MELQQPLFVSSRPWTEIPLDFLTGLPMSKRNTTVIMVVDRFSTMVHFIALPKLPSAKETSEVLLKEVVRIHGFPRDIVSDRGPHLASWFWKEFYNLLGAIISLVGIPPPIQQADRAAES